MIRRYHVSDASVHDSQALGNLLDKDNEADTLWADSTYRSKVTEAVLKLMGFDSFFAFGIIWVVMARVAVSALFKTNNQPIRVRKWGLLVISSIILAIVVALVIAAIIS